MSRSFRSSSPPLQNPRPDKLPLRLLTYLLKFSLLLVTLFGARTVRAQETVFDVPSADILDKGKVYGELDGTAQPTTAFFTYTPRVVVGISHNVELGLNFNGLSSPTIGQLVASPTVKWRLWNRPNDGWSFYVGDDLSFPVRERTYSVGNYIYAAFAKQWKHTRISAGAYDYTQHVVAQANRAGGQFTFEQQLSSYLTLAAEWYTGNTDVGYVNSGLIYKATQKLTLYAAYQVGNANVSKGNHQFLWEIGYNFN